MSGGDFPLDVDADQVDLAATRLRTLREDLEAERAGVIGAPAAWAPGWQGAAATAVTSEATALAGHMAGFGGHLEAAATALTDLAAAYRTALEQTLPALRARWADAQADCTAALATSAALRARDLAAVPDDAGAQQRVHQSEADSGHAARTGAATAERAGVQAAATAAYDQLLADLRQRTRATGQALAGAVVVPVPDRTVSSYLATGTTDLGPLPPHQLADLSLTRRSQLLAGLAAAAAQEERDAAAGRSDQAHRDAHEALRAAAGQEVAGLLRAGDTDGAAAVLEVLGEADAAHVLSSVPAGAVDERYVGLDGPQGVLAAANVLGGFGGAVGEYNAHARAGTAELLREPVESNAARALATDPARTTRSGWYADLDDSRARVASNQAAAARALRLDEVSRSAPVRLGGGLAAVGIAYDIHSGKEPVQAVAAGGAGFAASVGASMATGAMVGTLIPVPGVGTAVGAVVGAGVGIFTSGMVDSLFEDGPDVGEALGRGWEALSDTGSAVGGGALSVARSVGGWFD